MKALLLLHEDSAPGVHRSMPVALFVGVLTLPIVSGSTQTLRLYLTLVAHPFGLSQFHAKSHFLLSQGFAGFIASDWLIADNYDVVGARPPPATLKASHPGPLRPPPRTSRPPRLES